MDISKNPKRTTVADFDHLLRESHRKTIVVSFLSSCLGTSQLLAAFLDDLNHEYRPSAVSFHQISADQHPDFVRRRFGINGLPVTLILDQGKMSDFFRGILSKNKIRDRINAFV